MEKTTLDWVTEVLVLIGALNWGLVGALNFDLVATLFGSIPMLQKVVYILIGIAALWMGYGLTKK